MVPSKLAYCSCKVLTQRVDWVAWANIQFYDACDAIDDACTTSSLVISGYLSGPVSSSYPHFVSHNYIVTEATQQLSTAAMKISVIFFLIGLFFPLSAAVSRGSGSCFLSGVGPETQQCGDADFLCPADNQCKQRQLRCIPNSNICPSEGNCEESGNGYRIRLGRMSLFSKKRLERNHQFITYRGFAYEFGCRYRVQILDVNDPNYKYKDGSDVRYEEKGTSQCTYEQTLPFTKAWSKRYNVLTNNCQHFAGKFAEYLTKASCYPRQRNSGDLDAFAESMIANCTECCDPVTEPNSSSAIATAAFSSVIMLLHLIRL